ncbi:hypothetical protein Bcav_2542 [Beutenbergia cavernae DSM 12333]|uniref:Excreted virulence factor EspC, type VII ESX diderm n=1 Tax=Beutenbergia cavernae (strain ATCC BAA-8 / DSM 12333 / CCUG 43141 / JCM 11478 / NBRC 16432 / NCIMB 13614 / HKI 0122) TaxID=471853 RepID=C5BWX3_BEUC1|nr:hypothetical protein [Beutenbergia cavernae]ACQ80789.1 hypothetical protein Bcav_2542 [Beutenbergia cavernae DSM 12333]
MSEFSVDPEALRRLANGLRLGADAAAAARSYAGSWLPGAGGDGECFGRIDGARVGAAEATVAGLEGLGRALLASGDELDSSAAYYTDTDADRAAELDDDLDAVPAGGGNGEQSRGA